MSSSNSNNIKKTFNPNKLHSMLKLHEKGIPKKAETPAVLAIREAELKKRKNASIANTLGIFTIELYAFPNKTWVYDTGCGTNICNTLQGLRENRKLKLGALSQYVGNEMRVAVETIRSFDLVFPSGLIIVLDNYHYAPTITKGVVTISHLVNNGYIYTFTNYGISVLKDNVFYFTAIPRDGIYEIDMHNLYPNKRMDKLQRDGILQLIHDESLEKCKIVSREGASYFITFIDDSSRYGYVYLMKHKHEGYALEFVVRILNMVPTKEIFVARNAEFFKNSLMVQEASGSHGLWKLEEGLNSLQEALLRPTSLPEYPTRDFTIRREERSLNNNSFLGEYECSFLALDRDERRDEKKRLDHLKQDQTMLVIKRFSERNKVFRERKKTGKICAKRFLSNNDKTSNESLLDLKKVEGYMVRGEEDEKELVEMGEVGEGPFGEGEGGEGGSTAVAGVDKDKDAKKEKTGRIS
ncbi:hypothetical protein Tco_0105042 [Tanacetum coccineum]